MIFLGPTKAVLQKAIAVAEANLWLQQFGQTNDDAAWDGSTACTHVWCQYAALLWLDERLTINEVNKLAGMTYKATTLRNGFRVKRGMNNLDLKRFFERMKLPYVIRFGLPFETVLTYSNKAPAFYGNRYGSEPRQRGAVYHGVKAKAPYAIEGGATQLTGTLINGRHAAALLGYRSVLDAPQGKITGYRAWRKDANHGSPARRERPPYDVILTTEAKREFLDYRALTTKGRTYCALPTRNLPV